MPAQNNPFAEYLAKNGQRPTVRAAVVEVVAPVEDLATDAQRSFIDRLLAERAFGAHKFADRINEVRLGQGQPLTKQGASKLIDILKNECPLTTASQRAARTQDLYPHVPAGRYAVETEDGAENALAFYKVDRPEEGRWAGRVFVSLMQSDDEVRLNFDTQKAVLAKIAVDPAAASMAYGLNIGSCGVCGRTLTNDESRARGVGPKCAAKSGW